MIYSEDVYGTGRMRASPAYPQVPYGLTFQDAINQARNEMCALGWSPPSGKPCAEATCAEVQQKVCSDCTIFTGNDERRLVICGTQTCPAPGPLTGCDGGPPPGGGGDNNTMIIAVAAIAGVAVVAALVASQAKKKGVIARVER